MYMFTSKSEMLDDERLVLNDYLSFQEVQAEGEEPISENEEEIVVEISQASEGILGKRRRSVSTSDDNNNSDTNAADYVGDDMDLPVHRSTGRVRVRSKLLDGYETTFR